MRDDRESLLNEMKEYRNQPEQVRAAALDKRILRLQQVIESDPPTFENYLSLKIISVVLLTLGLILMILGVLGIIGSLLFTFFSTGVSYWQLDQQPSFGNNLNAFILQVMLLSLKVALGIGSSLVFIFGFGMTATSQMIKLAIDLQRNSDRQSAALHGIFHLLLSERNKNNSQA